MSGTGSEGGEMEKVPGGKEVRKEEEEDEEEEEEEEVALRREGV